METAMQLQDRRSHAVIDCIPVPAGAFAKAPLYFKKEIEEAESEWSQHHAKRLIDTRAKVRPFSLGLPYILRALLAVGRGEGLKMG